MEAAVWPWAGAVAVAAAVLFAWPGGPAPLAGPTPPRRVSAVIFPEQDIPLRFSHVRHLTLPGDQAPDCEYCHEDAADSRSSLDNLIPHEDVCTMCHDIERNLVPAAAADRMATERDAPAGEPPAACDACHTSYSAETGVVARVRIPPPNLKFSHAVHAGGLKMACIECHGDLAAAGVGMATRAELPSMRLCLGCHDGKRAAKECVVCHLAGPGGRMQTRFAAGDLMPGAGDPWGAAHDLSFAGDHRAAAAVNRSTCATCHRERFCLDCHSGVLRPMEFHGVDYQLMHAIDARRDSAKCSACHRGQTFCTGCHSRSGVSSDGRGSEFSQAEAARRFHPGGWVEGLGVRGPDHHSLQAQKNIRQCASCHRESFCVGCHTAEPGGLRVNPHPAGWARSRRCRALLARNRRVCLRCHIGPDEARCD